MAGRTADGRFFLRPPGPMTSTFDKGTRHPAPGTYFMAWALSQSQTDQAVRLVVEAGDASAQSGSLVSCRSWGLPRNRPPVGAADVGGDGRLFAGLGAGKADQMGEEGEDHPARQPDRS